MLHLHLLHTHKSVHSSMALPETDHLAEVARNYHELTVLAQARQLKANLVLPYHLSALEVMDMALSGSFALDA